MNYLAAMLAVKQSLNAQVGCKTIPTSGVQPGTDCRPSHRAAAAALGDSKLARLGSGAAVLIYFTAVAIIMIYFTAVANLS
jgi:hypothetical protein